MSKENLANAVALSQSMYAQFLKPGESLKAFVMNDLHLMKTRYGFNAVLLETAFESILEHKPQIVIIPGDINHTKDATYESVKAQFGWFLTRVSALPFIIHIYIAPGNHDWCIEHTLHSLHHFEDKSKFPKVTVVASSLMITEKVGLMGYARTLERFNENLDSLNMDTIKVLFGHFALNEFELGTGYEEVDLWCDASIFEKLSSLVKIYSGHWHKYQVKKMNGIEITYLGSPATVDHGEANQIKYFGIFDFDTFEMELIETGLTMHKSYKIDVGDPLPEIPEGEYQMGVETVVCIRGTEEQLAGYKTPSGYRGIITTEVIKSDSKRETIDAFSGANGIVNAYMDKKENDIRERLKVAYGDKISESEMVELLDKWRTFGRRIALDTGA
ncbi:metallophosphoesterase family protein [Bdellovibrio sp. BCCA]|uniref:metallophosphoesterase family protein n=1 Tax=Bdellovibrio sp. BCCA TaxID=3136281 RepID=UPI0030F1CD2F